MMDRFWSAVFALLVGAAVYAEDSSRTWDFPLSAPGTYKLQVEHRFEPDASGPRSVAYSLTIGQGTSARELALITNQPLVPLITDVSHPQKARVVVSGLTQEELKSTSVYLYEAGSVLAGEYYSPAKTEFKEAIAVSRILRQRSADIDLVEAKLAIDHLIDPSLDVQANLRLLGSMVEQIKAMPAFGTTETAKLAALRKYLYQAGDWNDFRPYQYDLSDPLGTRISNKLLAQYISSRKGNCVTMPVLFVLLGELLGLEVAAATAPKHVLAKWKNEAGEWINLETTSGANPARDAWIREQMPMTDEAIANRVYLQPLTKNETVALMATTLAEHYFSRAEYDRAIAIADLVLEQYPRNAETMVLKAAAFGRLRSKRFGTNAAIPEAQIDHFEYLSRKSRSLFAQAEALGWRAETDAAEAAYTRRVIKVQNGVDR